MRGRTRSQLSGVPATTTVHTCYGYAVYVKEKHSGYPFFEQLAELPTDYVAIETAQPGLDPAIVADLAPRGVVLGVLVLDVVGELDDVVLGELVTDVVGDVVTVDEPELVAVEVTVLVSDVEGVLVALLVPVVL